MIVSIISTLFKVLYIAFKPFLIVLLGVLAVFIFLCSIWIGIRFSQGKRFKKGEHKRLKKESVLYRLFVKTPRQFVDDLFDKDPDFFKYQGCIIFEGRQGAGKSVAEVEFATRMLKEYPKAKCLSNLGFKLQNEELEDWKKLMDYKNGIYGVVVIIDELQNWFSSMDSKNFPPEMLEVITQNRKNRRIILRYGTELLSTCEGNSFTSNRSASLYDATRLRDNRKKICPDFGF